MTVMLATGRYATMRPEDGIAVAISLGQPKWPLPYPLRHEVPDLMPFGLFGRSLPWADFEQGYRERLDRVGVDRLRRQFDAIAADDPGRPLVLLCWEPPDRPCHRRTFGAWWSERTGTTVPEVHDAAIPGARKPPDQLALDLRPISCAACGVDLAPGEGTYCDHCWTAR